VIVKRIAKSNFWQNPEESKHFHWCVHSKDQRESHERNQTMLLQQAQSQSCHSSTRCSKRLQKDVAKDYYAKGTSGRTFKQVYFLADGSN